MTSSGILLSDCLLQEKRREVERTCIENILHSWRVITTRNVDNFRVLLYSPRSSIMFQCHLKVELSLSQDGRIKYLLGKSAKDRSELWQLVRGEQNYDEIEKFWNAPYVSTSETIWHMLQVQIIDTRPSVKWLEHLQNQQTEYFKKNR